MTIASLFVSLGFKVEGDKELDNIDKGMKKTAGQAAIVAAALSGATLAFLAMAKAAVEAGTALANFNRVTGLSTDELQQWQYAAERNGVAAEEVVQSIKGIQEAQAQIRMGAGNVSPWQLLGINPNQDPFKVLEAIRERIRGLDPAIAKNITSQMGISEGTYGLLKLTNEEFGKLQAKFLVTKQNQKDLIELNRAWKDLTFSLKNLGTQIGAVFVPFLQAMVKVLKPVVSLLTTFVNWLNKGSTAATVVKYVLFALAGILVILTVAFVALAGALSLASLAFIALDVAAAPWTLIAFAIIVAIGLVIAAVIMLTLELEDLYKFFTGGKSVLGEALKAWTDFFDAQVAIVAGWYDKITGYFTGAWNYVKNIGAKMKGLIPDWLLKKLGFDGAVNIENPQPPDFTTGADLASQALSPTMQGGSRSVSQENNVNVTVNGASDPQATARAVGKTMHEELAAASYQLPIESF